MSSIIESTVKHWNMFPKEVFIPLQKKGRYKIITIKFRECNTKKELFNTIEFYKGIKFIDLLGTNDYFIGEFIMVNSSLWDLTHGTKALVLNPKFRNGKKELVKDRDDGFLKTYRSTKGVIITVV